MRPRRRREKFSRWCVFFCITPTRARRHIGAGTLTDTYAYVGNRNHSTVAYACAVRHRRISYFSLTSLTLPLVQFPLAPTSSSLITNLLRVTASLVGFHPSQGPLALLLLLLLLLLLHSFHHPALYHHFCHAPPKPPFRPGGPQHFGD